MYVYKVQLVSQIEERDRFCLMLSLKTNIWVRAVKTKANRDLLACICQRSVCPVTCLYVVFWRIFTFTDQSNYLRFGFVDTHFKTTLWRLGSNYLQSRLSRHRKVQIRNVLAPSGWGRTVWACTGYIIFEFILSYNETIKQTQLYNNTIYSSTTIVDKRA